MNFSAISISLTTFALSVCLATDLRADQIGLYGTPGLIDMPTAGILDDGYIALSYAQFGATSRNTLTFQITPHFYGAFRYAVIEQFDLDGQTRYDRSFDVHYQVFNESVFTPAVSIGLRDLGGTGIYSGEYVVATKSFGALTGTVGLGWGRLGARNSISNPLSIFNDGFDTRPVASNVGATGEFDIGSWFRGDAALFGGLSYAINDRTTVMLEYSSDTYEPETRTGSHPSQKSPYNFGISHEFSSGVTLAGYSMYGTDVGFMVGYQLNPAEPSVVGGRDPVAPPLAPRDIVASRSWNVAVSGPQLEQALIQGFVAQGLIFSAYKVVGKTATVTIENQRWSAEAQALGRAARVLANTLPNNIETFVIVFESNGVALSSVTLQRADLYDLEFALEGDWNIRARSNLGDGYRVAPTQQVEGAYPLFEFGVGPYLDIALFDPDSPVRYDLGVQVVASYEPTPGMILSGTLRYPFLSTIDDATRSSNSTIRRVRSEAFEYARQSELELNHLTLEYFYRPAPDMFGRITAGYLENMYGGVSAEMLWAPLDSRLALGGEINYAAQRDFDMLFGFQDYSVATGHASAYYDFGRGYGGKLDVGRYLGGDIGATVTLARRFDSGFQVGAFATVTNVSAADFGEGSFDKGIFFDAPLSFFTGVASREQVQRIIRPVERDGGARLQVRNRLYDMTRDYRTGDLSHNWGTFFR